MTIRAEKFWSTTSTVLCRMKPRSWWEKHLDAGCSTCHQLLDSLHAEDDRGKPLPKMRLSSQPERQVEDVGLRVVASVVRWGCSPSYWVGMSGEALKRPVQADGRACAKLLDVGEGVVPAIAQHQTTQHQHAFPHSLRVPTDAVAVLSRKLMTRRIYGRFRWHLLPNGVNPTAAKAGIVHAPARPCRSR